MSKKIMTLDVRKDIHNGAAPFSKIMSTVNALRPDEQLLLIVPFEPTPLFEVMQGRGFQPAAHRTEAGDWEVLFTRHEQAENSNLSHTKHLPGGKPPCPPPKEQALHESSTLTRVDARGLEPPQPLIKILEALATLPAGGQLCALTDRRPIHLYSQLEARGFGADTKEQSDGSYLIHICRH
jgi:uncharacterized protein (DUF2249 family)